MIKPCPHCQKDLITIYGITNCTAKDQNMYLDLRRCSACNKRFLYISTYSGSGASCICHETYLTLEPEDANMLIRAFYQCDSPMSRYCHCPAHSTAEQFIEGQLSKN